MIKTFDRTNLKVLQADLKHAMLLVAQKHGITVTLEGGSFRASEFRAKVVCTTGGTLSDEDRARKLFEEHAGAFFLKPSDYGASFTDPTSGRRGEVYEICGIMPKSRQYPILCRNTRGKVFKLEATTVLNGLNRPDAAKQAQFFRPYVRARGRGRIEDML